MGIKKLRLYRRRFINAFVAERGTALVRLGAWQGRGAVERSQYDACGFKADCWGWLLHGPARKVFEERLVRAKEHFTNDGALVAGLRTNLLTSR